MERVAHVPATLVHGDAANPSNILIRSDGISLLDWEWAIAADPAWEFCDLGWWDSLTPEGLAPYFEARGMSVDESVSFIKRVENLIPLWLLWGSHLHANVGKDATLYTLLRALLTKKLEADR